MAFWLWIALAIVVALIVIMLFSHIRIRVRYSRSGQLDQLVVVIQALNGLFHYQVILPSILIRGWSVVYHEKRTGGIAGDVNHKQNSRWIGKRTILRYIRAYRTVLKSTRQFKRWARRTLKKVECTRWRLDFRVGTGDAASTAVVTGLLWAVSGCASGVAGQYITLKTSPQSEIAPNYSATEFTVVWEADFRIRLGTAMGSFIKLGTKTIHIALAMGAWRNMLSSPKQA
ncbi:DUF2953 domain-containing protein [Cohnella silvisoli]|uniref:DUF2953 domain-containing protein n=1 Tax=Cohnella silvisoli TaxID=2873699 RepID=A0ABV1KSI0_9BACL|nr:DUF2953 domain-containing protein [Cohnella silvisoli]MCD9021253.1 DUF2953 domain-containing protein [Cohnella silvisoli]